MLGSASRSSLRIAVFDFAGSSQVGYGRFGDFAVHPLMILSYCANCCSITLSFLAQVLFSVTSLYSVILMRRYFFTEYFRSRLSSSSISHMRPMRSTTLALISLWFRCPRRCSTLWSYGALKTNAYRPGLVSMLTRASIDSGLTSQQPALLGPAIAMWVTRAVEGSFAPFGLLVIDSHSRSQPNTFD